MGVRRRKGSTRTAGGGLPARHSRAPRRGVAVRVRTQSPGVCAGLAGGLERVGCGRTQVGIHASAPTRLAAGRSSHPLPCALAPGLRSQLICPAVRPCHCTHTSGRRATAAGTASHGTYAWRAGGCGRPRRCARAPGAPSPHSGVHPMPPHQRQTLLHGTLPEFAGQTRPGAAAQAWQPSLGSAARARLSATTPLRLLPTPLRPHAPQVRTAPNPAALARPSATAVPTASRHPPLPSALGLSGLGLGRSGLLAWRRPRRPFNGQPPGDVARHAAAARLPPPLRRPPRLASAGCALASGGRLAPSPPPPSTPHPSSLIAPLPCPT